MSSKSYIAPDEYDDEKYVHNKFKDFFDTKKKYISQTDRIKKEAKHRSIENFEKKIFEEYKRKYILGKNNKNIIYKNISTSKETIIPEGKNLLKSKLKINNKDYIIDLPLLKYSILQVEKKIIENKNKKFAEKRNEEEINKNKSILYK